MCARRPRALPLRARTPLTPLLCVPQAELAVYIGQPTETTERHELPNLVGLFCFHAFLSSNGGKGAALDKKMYTTIWALCKRVPLVPLSGVAMWRPLQFMARVLPIKSSSLSVDAAGKIEADHLKSVKHPLVC